MPEELRSSPGPSTPRAPSPVAAPPSPEAAIQGPELSSNELVEPDQRNENDTDSLQDQLEDLPRMPDTSSEEESGNEDGPDNGQNVAENDPDIEQIQNEPLLLHRQFQIENQQSNRRQPGRAVRASSVFMHGKYLILPIQPGETNVCALCQMYSPLDEDKSEILSYELEKKLYRNGVLESRGDGFGISYSRQRGQNQWQVICKSCLQYDGDNQDVIDAVFRVKFHFDHNNIDSEADWRNIFSEAPELAMDVIRDIRNDWIALNRAYSLDMRYYQRKIIKKFYFTADESRIFLGLDADEFNHIYKNYLRPYAGRYTVFDVKEIFACLMLMLRSGQPLSWVHRMIVKYTDIAIDIHSLSKSMRKTLFFLGNFNKLTFDYFFVQLEKKNHEKTIPKIRNQKNSTMKTCI